MSTVALNAVLDGSPLVTDWQGRTRHLTGGEKAVLLILATVRWRTSATSTCR